MAEYGAPALPAALDVPVLVTSAAADPIVGNAGLESVTGALTASGIRWTALAWQAPDIRRHSIRHVHRAAPKHMSQTGRFLRMGASARPDHGRADSLDASFGPVAVYRAVVFLRSLEPRTARTTAEVIKCVVWPLAVLTVLHRVIIKAVNGFRTDDFKPVYEAALAFLNRRPVYTANFDWSIRTTCIHRRGRC